MILLDGHELTPLRKLRPEALSVTLKERDSTASVTPDRMDGITVDSWLMSDEGPGNGTVWRVRSIGQAYQTGTTQVQLEHAITMLRDRVLFGEIKPKDITGVSSATTCTARQAINYILSQQTDWELDELHFDYDDVSAAYKFDGDTLFDALEKVSGTLADCWWSYDCSVYPFKLMITEKPATEICELRPGRNLKTISKSIDRSGMFTRFYPIGKNDLHLSGNPYLSKNENTYGVIAKIGTDESLDTVTELAAWANEQLDRHAEPLVSITAEGFAIAEATGEPLDRITLGRLCRIPLNEYNTVITERIIQLDYPDAAFQPENVKVTLSNKREDVTKIIADALKSAGRRGRSSARKDKEDNAWFEDTTEHVSMCAKGVVGVDAQGNPNWVLLSNITADGTGIHQTVQSVQNDVLLSQAEIIMEKDQAGLLIERTDTRPILVFPSSADFPATGQTGKIYLDVAAGIYYEWSGSAYTQTTPGNVVKRGGIISAINEDSTITTNILGEKIIIGELDDEDLDSWAADAKHGTGTFAKFLTVRTLTAQEINTLLADIGDATIDDLHVGTIDVEILTVEDGITTDSIVVNEINGNPADDFIVDAEVNAGTNTLILTKSDGTTVTFSKAATGSKLTGAWSGNTLTISPSATGLDAWATTVTAGFRQTTNPNQYFIDARKLDNSAQSPTVVNSIQYQLGRLSASPTVVRILNAAGTAFISDTPSYTIPLTTRSVTANGTYTPGSSYVGYSSVTVNVPSDLPNAKARFNAASGSYYIEAYDNVSGNPVSGSSVTYQLGRSGTKVQIQSSGGSKLSNTPEYTIPLTTQTVTANGTYTPASGYAGFSSVTVNVSGGTDRYDEGWADAYATVGLDSTTTKTLNYTEQITVYAQAKATSGASGKTNVASRIIKGPTPQAGDLTWGNWQYNDSTTHYQIVTRGANPSINFGMRCVAYKGTSYQVYSNYFGMSGTAENIYREGYNDGGGGYTHSMTITRASWHSVSGTRYYGKLYYYDDDSGDYEPVVNSNKYWYYSNSNKSGSTTVHY